MAPQWKHGIPSLCPYRINLLFVLAVVELLNSGAFSGLGFSELLPPVLVLGLNVPVDLLVGIFIEMNVFIKRNGPFSEDFRI